MRFILFLFFFFFGAGFMAAQPYYYAPNSMNFPVLGGEWDANLRLGLSRGGSFDAREVHAAASWQWAAAFVNYFDANEKEIKNRTAMGGSSHFLEGGIGVLYSGAKTTTSLLAGYGIGTFFNTYNLARTSELDVQKAFVQPTITYYDDYFVGALGIRFSNLQYIQGKVDYAIDPEHIEIIKIIERESRFFLPEIGFQAGMRLSPIYFAVNITTVFPNVGALDFGRFNAGISLNCRLSELLRKPSVPTSGKKKS